MSLPELCSRLADLVTTHPLASLSGALLPGLAAPARLRLDRSLGGRGHLLDAFEPDREEYLVHVTTGTHVAQICLFLLTETRYFPARLIQTAPPRHRQRMEPGSFSIIDLDLSKYDRLAARFERQQREGLSWLKAGIDTKSPAFN